MKKIIAIAMGVALLMSQSGIAQAAFSSDIKLSPIKASADLATGINDIVSLSATVKDLNGDPTASGDISWTAVTGGDGWTKASQFIEVKYNANQQNWGVLIYTDNKGVTMTANPQYPGDPATAIDQQPAGLIGENNSYLTCPMVMLLTKTRIADPANDLEVPVETLDGTQGEPGAAVYFRNGLDEIPEKTDSQGNQLPVKYEKVWHWLKDLSSTKWPIDTNDDGIADPGEIVSDFDYLTAARDEYATIVNSLGISSGWWNAPSNTMVRDFNLGAVDANNDYTLNVYLAADFRKAREKQNYTTGTLTLELYHETP